MTDRTELEDEVIFDGIRFMESLSRCYGAEQAVAVWDRLGEALGTDIKHQVFFAMLTGETSNRMRIRVSKKPRIPGILPESRP